MGEKIPISLAELWVRSLSQAHSHPFYIIWHDDYRNTILCAYIVDFLNLNWNAGGYLTIKCCITLHPIQGILFEVLLSNSNDFPMFNVLLYIIHTASK